MKSSVTFCLLRQLAQVGCSDRSIGVPRQTRSLSLLCQADTKSLIANLHLDLVVWGLERTSCTLFAAGDPHRFGRQKAMVTDNDPRAQGSSSSSATQRRRKKRPQQAPSSSAPAGTEENVIVGDLARMVGVHGKTQEIMGHSVPLIYLIVGAIALLWISGNTNAIHMIVLGFLIYMYSQYTRAQSGGSGGSPPDDNSSRGHVINPGR
ncbi:unnamed protein product [Durusdinium trenchii]|uniref:PRA1 family protein n=1 Tax=Durusdinium trenchii TaxID=1381693 RepID=A0ABP0JZI1_9DINO